MQEPVTHRDVHVILWINHLYQFDIQVCEIQKPI